MEDSVYRLHDHSGRRPRGMLLSSPFLMLFVDFTLLRSVNFLFFVFVLDNDDSNLLVPEAAPEEL